ncbi:leucine-rich repeat domain-containing protein [Planococcus salinarum]|uniref:leucine-rich repeat domain-containing protein n=1 Tax=Planococcus salinarum TaxID=622695 RepID=UPI000E3EE3C0|nr:leucine-rich repeat domain-containing protein [Planococcus salinarum]TAA71992.1 hypothetical protein D2909_08285 [Planococcus salinarum]
MAQSSSLYFIDSGEKETGTTMVLTSYWNEQLKNVMLEQGIQHLRLSRSVDWEDQDIDFLKSLDFLKGIEIYAFDIKDVSVLHHLPTLEHIGLECNLSVELDISQFKHLRIFFSRHSKKLKKWWKVSTLERLNLTNYPFEDLMPLQQLVCLKSLQLTSTKLQTLNGINHLKNLQLLDLYSCPKLISLESLNALKSLEEIEFDSCKRIEKLDEIEGLENLRKFILTNCGDIQSIEPLKNCLHLKKIFIGGNTTITDGDFSPLLELPNLTTFIFVEKKHYSYKQKEVEAILRE